MAITGAPDVAQPPAARRVSPVGAARALLLLGWAAIALATVLTGSLAAPLGDLEHAVATGRVTEVSATHGFADPSSTGSGIQQVRWRDGLVERRTEVLAASPGADTIDSDLPFVGRDVVPRLQALAPGQLSAVPFERPSSSSTAFGFQVPVALGLLAAAWWVCSVTLLAGGPEPFLATRWAWFWLSLLPGGVVAFLALSGRVGTLPTPRPGSRRLTGGWALVLTVVVANLR